MLKIQIKRILFLIPLLILIFSFTPVSACSCPDNKTISDEVNDSSAVFMGIVTKIEEPSIASKIIDKKIVDLSVSKIWKGNIDRTAIVSTSLSSAACGFNFQKDYEYIVYANKSDSGYDVNLCSRTNVKSAALDDLARLGNPIKVIEPVKSTSPWVIAGYVAIFLVSFNITAFAGYFLYKYFHKKNLQNGPTRIS